MYPQENKVKELLPISMVLIFAYALRVLQPDIFIIGWDLPAHIIAAMRLHGTSFFHSDNINQNFFYQLFVYNHGYTTRALPYFLYEFFFDIAGLTITEASLTFINSLMGIFSLGAIYYFLRQSLSQKISLISIIIISLTPIHIGLSRVHVGYQIIQLIFFYLSLAFLHRLINSPSRQTKLLYFITTFLYIGSENAFPVGMFLHIIYIFLQLPTKSVGHFLKKIQEIYISALSIVFIVIPLSIYGVITFFLLQQHITTGYLLKTVSKHSTLGPILRFPLASAELVGPIVVLFVFGIFKFKKISKSAILQYFAIQSLIYFTLLCKLDVNAAYVLYLLPPVTAMAVSLFIDRKILLSSVAIGTIALSLSIIYNVRIGFPTMYTYGSQYINRNNGLKTLGYLIRSNTFDITEIYDDNGIGIKKLNLFTGFPSGYYYLGAFNYGKPFQQSLNGTAIKKPFISTANKRFLLAKWLTYDKSKYYKGMGSVVGKANMEIDGYVSKHKTPLIGYITDGNRKLIALYSNIKSKTFTNYDINIYDQKFDQEFGTMDSFNFPLTGYELF